MLSKKFLRRRFPKKSWKIPSKATMMKSHIRYKLVSFMDVYLGMYTKFVLHVFPLTLEGLARNC